MKPGKITVSGYRCDLPKKKKLEPLLRVRWNNRRPNRANRDTNSSTPACRTRAAHLTGHSPLLVAKMTMGDSCDSSARLRKVKHSMSSMCT